MKRGPIAPAKVKVTENGLRRRLACNMKRLRVEMRMTQEAAAERADLHPRQWQRLEAGERNACLSTLVGVANALDVDPAELFAKIPPRS